MLPNWGFAGAPGEEPVKLTQPNATRQALPAGKSDAIFFDDDLPGFGLRIRAGGKRTWIIQYRVGAKQRRLTLGSLDRLSADQARKAAKAWLARVELGGDPQQEKHEARAAASHTVGKLIDDYLARRHHETGKDRLRKSSYESTECYLRKHWKPLHNLQATKVDRNAIATRLNAIETGISSVTAARARVALSTMFAWAIGEGRVEINPVIGTNKPPEPVARDRVLSDAEVGEIWAACRDDSFGYIVKLLLLTGARRDEIGDLAWNEIDLDERVINLPPGRTKNGRPHSVPLAPPAIAILESVPHSMRADGTLKYLFGEGQGGFSGWSKAKAALNGRINDARTAVAAGLGKTARKSQPIVDWRLHDLRRTVATVMAGKLGVLPHIIEATLNHVSGHKAGVAGVYNRATYDREVAAALLIWADHLKSIVEGGDRKIVPMRKEVAP
jgi:integrase